ncbi:porin [Methylovirgula sp. 4M-Z18]|uniref:porin n=1 Tax=Methylovirgula sp. 4M-Z18 TaxID=2293567 RepID=UPI000E2E45E9|nr:porin [Methylovirgula sp. 4M-Z18]RFB80837.1 porin [Methylovirgula sp. 4M-Z18]
MRGFLKYGAAALAVVGASGAYAADLPSKKAAPAEYVKVCSVHGTGYFYIPGTDTCLQIGGYVRVTYIGMNVGNTATLTYKGPSGVTPQSSHAQNATGFSLRAVTTFDARTTTAYGTLRSYMKFYMANTSGANPLGYSLSSPFSVKFGFVQWAGITAGRAQSMFDFYADDLGQDDVRGPDKTVNMLAYTATFGNGFSATLAIEDSQSTGTVPALTTATNTVSAYSYEGTRQPDVIANVRVDQSWGAAQLSGIYNDQNVLASSDLGAFHKSASGWGVLGGVQIKLPMIAPGDVLWLQSAYMHGILSRQTQGNPRGWQYSGSSQSNGYGSQKGWIVSDYETLVVNNSVKMPTSYSAVLAFKHNWSAQWASSLEASYLNVRYPSAVTGGAKTKALTSNWNEWRVGGGLYWMPVTGLTIGADLYYTRLDQKAPIYNGVAFTGAGTGLGFKKINNGYEGLLRVQRNF